MDPPDLAEHGSISQSEAQGEQPRRRATSHGKRRGADKSTVKSQGNNGQKTQDHSQQHDVIARWVRMLNDPPMPVSKVEVNQAAGDDHADQRNDDHGDVQPDVQLEQKGLHDGPILGDFAAHPYDL